MDVALQNNGQNYKGLRELTEQFVGQVFYGTLLREFRDAGRGNILDNGPGATTFIKQLDMELVKRIGGRTKTELADSLMKQLGRAKADIEFATSGTRGSFGI